MALRILTLGTRCLKPEKTRIGTASFGDNRKIVGNREIVGHGFNGQPNYVDRPDFPFPAVRWKEPTQDLLALREKEKGDWHKLSKADKKALYRASFRLTFAEFQVPQNEWKSVLGIFLTLCSFSLWWYYFLKTCVYSPPPYTFGEEYRLAQLRRWIDMHNNPVEGLASCWDYENDTWKDGKKFSLSL